MPYARRLYGACDGHAFFTDMDAPGDDSAGDFVRVQVPPSIVKPHAEGWLLNKNMIGLAPAWSQTFKMGVPKNYDWAINLELDHFFIASRIRRTILEFLDVLRMGTDKEVASLDRPMFFAWGNAFLFDSRMMKLMSEHWDEIAKPITDSDNGGMGCPEYMRDRATQLGACQQDMAYPLLQDILRKRSKEWPKMYGDSGCNTVPEHEPFFPLSCWQPGLEDWPQRRLVLITEMAHLATKKTVEEADEYCKEKAPSVGNECRQLWHARKVPVMHLFKSLEIHELGARLFLH